MAKFSKGDKVESVKTGAKGVVDEVYGEEKYAVLFDGATNPDRVEGFQIKAANGCARNAKDRFGAEINVGDTVKFLTGTWRGLEGVVMKIDGNKATVRTEERGDVIEDLNIIRVYNSRPISSANAVVQNAINARTARNLRLVPFESDRVKQGDSVWYRGREFAFKGMSGSQRVRLEDVFDGEEEVIDITDRNLKMAQNAINARRARNAIEDAEGARRWDSLWRKVADLKREAEALDRYLVGKKQYGYSAKLESLAKCLTGF